MQFPFKICRDREFDVVGFGTNAVDFLIEVPEYPVFNSKIELSDYAQAAGGEAATTMVGLQRLGLKTTYAGCFGDDPAGAFGLKSLTDEGVSVDYSRTVSGARTQIAFIVIDSRSGERTVIWKRDKKLAFTAENAPVEIVSRAAVLHLTPHDTAAALAMAQAAKHAGTIVSIDVDKTFDNIEELLPLVDILIASAEFPPRLLGPDDPRKYLPEMASRYGCQIVGVTLGSAGSLLHANGSFIESKAFKVPGGCRDTTGAGDAFRVGIIYGLLNKNSIEEAAQYANAVACLKCRAIGARSALPSENELKEFLGR
ncbi:MAG TPA: carbohydrate kinase family protein [Pyrinomonadaceae bacterium]|nr:carbohydrate kinase family protein [Pyrinomonadaceae bacterium]